MSDASASALSSFMSESVQRSSGSGAHRSGFGRHREPWKAAPVTSSHRLAPTGRQRRGSPSWGSWAVGPPQSGAGLRCASYGLSFTDLGYLWSSMIITMPSKAQFCSSDRGGAPQAGAPAWHELASRGAPAAFRELVARATSTAVALERLISRLHTARNSETTTIHCSETWSLHPPALLPCPSPG